MENKQSFGAYIQKRRKELGMTQKEFAEQLFVTDSAVSKWERGLAYPDITLLQPICAVLQISEKELLSSAEDVEGRRAAQLARQYLRLLRNYRLIQLCLYGLTALGCLIGNLAGQHTLDWFWIVVTAEAMAASLTLLPTVTPPRWRGMAVLGGFTGSLLLLLAVCCLYTGGDWFFVAMAWILFGAGLVCGPYVLRRVPLPPILAGRKASLYLAGETVLILLALGINFLYCGVGSWFFTTAAAILFGVWLVFGPVFVRQLPLQGRRGLVYVAAGTGFLLLLLLASCLESGGTWFRSAALWSVLGIALVCLPLVIGQIPWPAPLRRHKALLYLGILSVCLVVCLAADGWGLWFPLPSLPVALLCLVLPWLWLGGMRYLPIGRWFRAAACFLATGLWAYLAPWALDRILMASGSLTDHPYSLAIEANLFCWTDPALVTGNVLVLIYLSFALAALLCLGIGLWRRAKRRQ